jgi:hypothetical protein
MTTALENGVGNSDEPRPVLGGQNAPFLITGQRTDPASGEQLWIASPIKEPGPAQEIRIRIPGDVHDRQQILESLSGQGEQAKLYLMQGPTDQCHEVFHAEPALPDAQRAVYDEKGLVYTWSRELEEGVDELFQHAIQARIFTIQAKLLKDEKQFGPIVAHARDVFAAEMRACGDTRATEELGHLFDHGMDPALAGAKDTYADAMMGRQLTEKGEVERVYYDASVPLSQQINVPGEPAARAATVANYALQRAVYDHMHACVGQTTQGKDATGISFLECVEADLVMQKFLHGFHPSRTSTDYIQLQERFSDRLISATVQGVVCSMGGRAANKDYDWVTTPGECTFERDEHGRPYTLQSHLYDKAYRDGQIVHYADHEKNHGEPNDYLKKLNAAYNDSSNEYVATKETAVAEAMDRAMAAGRTRVSDSGKFIKNRLDDLAEVKKGLVSIFEEVEETPPIIF